MTNTDSTPTSAPAPTGVLSEMLSPTRAKKAFLAAATAAGALFVTNFMHAFGVDVSVPAQAAGGIGQFVGNVADAALTALGTAGGPMAIAALIGHQLVYWFKNRA